MRFLILPYAAWMGLIGMSSPTLVGGDIPRILASAGVLGSLTVLVYRLGVWRQEMESTKANVGDTCTRIEQRLEGLDHMIADYMEHKQRTSRRYRRIIRRLELLEEKTP